VSREIRCAPATLEAQVHGRKWARFKCHQVLGLDPPTLTEARRLWRERKARLTVEELAELRRRYRVMMTQPERIS
jgi:hypothetical protein